MYLKCSHICSPRVRFVWPIYCLRQEFACDAINDVVGFTGAAPNGVVAPPCDRAR